MKKEVIFFYSYLSSGTRDWVQNPIWFGVHTKGCELGPIEKTPSGWVRTNYITFRII